MPVTDAELKAELEHHVGPMTRLERRPGPYRSSFAIEELSVETAAGKRIDLVFKDVGPKGLGPAARGAKPAFLYEPLREPETYTRILGPLVPDAPAVHAIVAAPDRGRYWLFLERVDGTPLHEVGELGRWRQAARWLAGLHERCRDARHPYLLRYDAELYGQWLERAVTLRSEAGTWLREVYPYAIERLCAAPLVFLHGEFYASNVLVADDGGRTRIRPVDWEMAAVGPALLDLAALTSGRWTAEQRRELATAYYDAVADNRWAKRASFDEELASARLHVAVQWLGWSDTWNPPPEHDHDWLEEAQAAARELGL